jgi:hypothetical protein
VAFFSPDGADLAIDATTSASRRVYGPQLTRFVDLNRATLNPGSQSTLDVSVPLDSTDGRPRLRVFFTASKIVAFSVGVSIYDRASGALLFNYSSPVNLEDAVLFDQDRQVAMVEDPSADVGTAVPSVHLVTLDLESHSVHRFSVPGGGKALFVAPDGHTALLAASLAENNAETTCMVDLASQAAHVGVTASLTQASQDGRFVVASWDMGAGDQMLLPAGTVLPKTGEQLLVRWDLMTGTVDTHLVPAGSWWLAPSGMSLLLTSQGNWQRIRLDGSPPTEVGPFDSQYTVTSLAFADDATAYLLEPASGGAKVIKLGATLGEVAIPFHPGQMALAHDGSLVGSDQASSRVISLSPAGATQCDLTL